jgi:NAD kinase
MYERLIVVTRKTRLEELVERFNSRAQAKFYIEHSGGDFVQYVEEDSAYHGSMDVLQKSLPKIGLKMQLVAREFVPSFIFTEKDVIVTAGQDGLVANTAKYVGAQPIVAINPDPQRIDGVLIPFQVQHAPAAVAKVISGKAQIRQVTLAQAKLNDGQRQLAFNDLFIGAASHVSARYKINVEGSSERQSSSGIIVSTGAGSTGWLSSIFNMAAGIARFAEPNKKETLNRPQLRWEDPRLMYVVREPFVSRQSGAELVAGMLERGHEITLESLMPSGGVIFSDGIEADYLAFNSGAIAKIGMAEQCAQLVAA